MDYQERWLGGADGHVVAPFVNPATLLPAGRVVVVLLGSDLAALAWSAAMDAGLLLRTTPRAERARLLGAGAGSSVVVTSIDSLHSPILRKEMCLGVPGAPWLVWHADHLSTLHPDNAGRGHWVTRHRDACRGGALLWRHADRRLAPAEADTVDASAGALLRVGPGQPGPLLRLARGISAGPDGLSDALGHRLGEAGLARRVHDLRRLQRRSWQQADRALRSESRGIDAFSHDPGVVPGRGLLRTVGAALPSDLAVPAGAALGQVEVQDDTPPPVTEEAVEQVRQLLGAQGTTRWVALAGDAPGVDPVLMADLAAVGMLEALRPAQLAARVADLHRFRPPRVDREPEYRALHDDYQAALGGLSLTERVRFALTDQAPQDLRGLAEQLGREPAAVADLLVTMDDDGLVTAFGEPLGGELDWQAIRGPRWEAESEDLVGAIEQLRGDRQEAASRVASVLSPTEGCRTRFLMNALSVSAGEPCGRCDLCDPEDTAWSATVSASMPALHLGGASPRAGERQIPGLHSLFSGLGSGPRAEEPAAPTWSTEDFAAALAGHDAERLSEAVEEAGSPTLLWLRGAWEDATSGRARPIRPEEGSALVDLLIDEAGPGVTSTRGSARRLPNGVVEVRLPGGGVGTSRRFAERPDTWDVLAAAADQEQPPGPLSRLRSTRAGRDAWQAWLGSIEGALAAWLKQNGGLPDLRTLLPESPTVDVKGSAWQPALATLTSASTGDLDGALQSLPDVPGAEIVETLILAALGEWPTLWGAALEALSDGPLAGGLVARLEGRSLLGLDPVPPLVARVASSWLDWAQRELDPAQIPMDRVVAAVTGGSARDFVALSKRAPVALVADRAVTVGVLPEKLVAVALERHELVDVLAAVADAANRAPAVWKRYAAALGREEQRSLVAALERRSAAMAAAGAAHLAHLDLAVAHRQRVLDLAAEGRLVEVLPLLAGLESQDPELDAVRLRVAQAQRRYTEPLALALSGPDHDPAAWGALRKARTDGWLDPMVLLLQIQSRRHPADGRRALWLARAFAVSGRWFEAEKQFGEAASLEEGQPLALELEFEGVDLALDAGQGRRVGEWLVRLVRTRRTRALAREITTRLWADKLPADACEILQAELQQDGGGLYAGALRALQEKRRR